MSKQAEIKNGQSFLQRFTQKKQFIDRQGLLKLLDMKRRQIEKSQQKSDTNHRALIKIKQDKIQQVQLKIQSGRRKHKSKDWNNQSNGNKKQDRMVKYSININNSMKQSSQKSVQIRNNLKLPAINKSNIINRVIQRNHSENNLPKRKVQNSVNKYHELHLQTQVSQVVNNRTQKLELDKDAMQHLDLLNKFQRLLVDTRLCNGQRSIFNLKIS